MQKGSGKLRNRKTVWSDEIRNDKIGIGKIRNGKAGRGNDNVLSDKIQNSGNENY